MRLILMTPPANRMLLATQKDVHFEDAEWHIPQENSKRGKPHIAYLSKQAVMPLRELVVLAGTYE